MSDYDLDRTDWACLSLLLRLLAKELPSERKAAGTRVDNCICLHASDHAWYRSRRVEGGTTYYAIVLIASKRKAHGACRMPLMRSIKCRVAVSFWPDGDIARSQSSERLYPLSVMIRLAPRPDAWCRLLSELTKMHKARLVMPTRACMDTAASVDGWPGAARPFREGEPG